MDAACALPRSAHRRQWPIVLVILLLAPPLLFAAALLWPLSAPPLPEPGNSLSLIHI